MLLSLSSLRKAALHSLLSQGRLSLPPTEPHPAQSPRSQFGPGVKVQLSILGKQREGGSWLGIYSLQCCFHHLSVSSFWPKGERRLTAISQCSQTTGLSLKRLKSHQTLASDNLNDLCRATLSVPPATLDGMRNSSHRPCLPKAFSLAEEDIWERKNKAYQKAPQFSMMCVLFHCNESINPTSFNYRYVGEKGLTEMEVPARFSYSSRCLGPGLWPQQ